MCWSETVRGGAESGPSSSDLGPALQLLPSSFFFSCDRRCCRSEVACAKERPQSAQLKGFSPAISDDFRLLRVL